MGWGRQLPSIKLYGVGNNSPVCSNQDSHSSTLRPGRQNSQVTMSSAKELNDVSLDSWETNASFWDDSIGKDGNIYWQKLQEPSLRRLLGDHLKRQHGQKPCLALDLATGNGLCARWLAKHGAKVYATDGSENMLQIARNWTRGEDWSENVRFWNLDVTRTEDFDVLIDAYVCF